MSDQQSQGGSSANGGGTWVGAALSPDGQALSLPTQQPNGKPSDPPPAPAGAQSSDSVSESNHQTPADEADPESDAQANVDSDAGSSSESSDDAGGQASTGQGQSAGSGSGPGSGPAQPAGGGASAASGPPGGGDYHTGEFRAVGSDDSDDSGDRYNEEHIGVGRPYTGRLAAPGLQPGWSQPGPPQPGPPQPKPGPSGPQLAGQGQGQGQGGQGQQPGQPPRPPAQQPGNPPQGNPQQAPSYWTPRPSDLPPPAPVTRRTGMEAAGFSGPGGPPPPQGQQGQAGPPGPPPGRQQPPQPQRTPPPPPQRGGRFEPQPFNTADDDDELLEVEHRRPRPRSGWQGAVYRMTRINLGPSRKDLQEIDIRQKLNRQLRRTRGYCGYVGISSEKGGVGKTTLAALLAAEIAEGRRESVGVADLNPDLGTLPDRFGVRPQHSIRDLLAHVDEIPWRYHVHDFMEKVPEMNVRVLAASTDRKIRHQLSVSDVELLAELFAPFFSFAILDNGTHITHEAMLGTLRVAHGMVLVTDNTKDGANLARKTLQFLTDNGFPEMRRRVVLAVVAKETASPVKVRAIEKAFRDHVRELVVVPYDPALDGGGKIPFRDPNAVNKLLRPQTRAAVRRLAAIVIDDLVN
ncbi:MinD/ParA family ATP-binding protein [Flindersiella endophytica]